MAQSSGSGMGLLEIILLGVGAYVLYEWYEGQQAAAAAAAAPVTPAAAAPVTSTGAYTTALTSQPASTSVAAPVSTAMPPATAPPTITSTLAPVVQAPVTTDAPVGVTTAPTAPTTPTTSGSTLSCSNAAYNSMATALAAMAAGVLPLDVNGNVIAGAPVGSLNIWQWDWYVANKMGGTGIANAVAAATGNNNLDATPVTACQYVAMRAQYGAATGLSGVGRMNVAMTWRPRQSGPVGAWS